MKLIQQGKTFAQEAFKGGLKEAKELPFVRTGINIFLEPMRRVWQDQADARFGEFLHRSFNGTPSEADWKDLEKKGHDKIFTEFSKMVLNDSDSLKVKIYSEACKAIMEDRVDVTYRADFIHAVSELSFKDFDFLSAIVQGVQITPEHVKAIFKNYSEQKLLKQTMESTKNYLLAQMTEPHVPSINRLCNAGALTLPSEGQPSRPSNLGYALCRVLKDVIGETVHDAIERFWEENKHKSYQKFNPHLKQFEVMTPPGEGWTKEQLASRARPGMEGILSVITPVKEAAKA